MKKFIIFSIHGMGDQPKTYYKELERYLNRYLSAAVKKDMLFYPLFYHNAMQDYQNKLWERTQKKEVDWKRLRRFFLYFFSDAATSEHHPERKDSVYRKIQRKILFSLNDAHKKVGKKDVPVIVIGHSLGCQVLSNYIWDAQKGNHIWEKKTPNSWQQFGTLRYLFTAGCNIPLFVSGFKRIVAFNKPNARFRWYNYYDRDDILGWPLKPLSSSYKRLVSEDIEINTGFTPLSHMAYWRDRSFLKPVTNKITQFHASL